MTKVDSWTFLLLAVSFGVGSAQFGRIRISKFQNDTQVSNNSTRQFCFTYPKSLFEPQLEPRKSYRIVDATTSSICSWWGKPLPADNQTLLFFRREGNFSLSRYIMFTKVCFRINQDNYVNYAKTGSRNVDACMKSIWPGKNLNWL